MALSPKRQRFVDEYLVDLNAAAAYERAGYSVRSAHQASANAARLMADDSIQAAIAAAQAQRSSRLEIQGDQVVREVARIAFSDLRKLTTWGPAGVVLRDSSTIDDDAAAAVAEVSQTTTQAGGTIRFKLHSKIQALDLLGKYLGVWDGKALLDRIAALERALNGTQADGDPGPTGSSPPGPPPEAPPGPSPG